MQWRWTRDDTPRAAAVPADEITMTSIRIVLASLALSLAVPALASDVSSDRRQQQSTDTMRHASGDAAKAAPAAPVTACACKHS